MLKTFIIENENNSLELLTEQLKTYCPQVRIEGNTDNITEALTFLKKRQIDLVFLDVELNNGEMGFDLFATLHKYTFKVIFTTAYDKYALRALKLSCLDYLLKPIEYQELQSAVLKFETDKEGHESYKNKINTLLHNINNSTKVLKLSIPLYGSSNVFIDMDDIVVLKADGAYTQVITKDKKSHLSSKNLGEFEKILDSDFFFRSNKTEIVNLKYLRRLNRAEDYEIILEGNLVFYVSFRKREEFSNRLQLLSING
jgi:two-component system, LytTR family, response regulator